MTKYNPKETHKTSDDYSPWDLLPVPEPKTVSPPLNYFYDNVAKHLIKDTVRVMQNGLPIDLDKVEELEGTLDIVLADVKTSLEANPLIKTFQSKRYEKMLADYRTEQEGKKRDHTYYLKPFKQGDMVHRSYFMYLYAQDKNLPQPSETVPTGKPKWTVKDAKKFESSHIIIKKLVNKTINDKNSYVINAMKLLAQDRADIFNRTYEENIKNPKLELPEFNPASSLQKQELFDFLGLESEATSATTGLPSWNRDQVERVNKETQDDDIRNLTQAMIDYSFGAIVKNNFIKAFYDYTIEGRLYGNYKLLGAKTGRYTSSNP